MQVQVSILWVSPTATGPDGVEQTGDLLLWAPNFHIAYAPRRCIADELKQQARETNYQEISETCNVWIYNGNPSR